MQLNVYPKSTQHINKILCLLMLIVFLTIGIAGIIENINNNESCLSMIILMTIALVGISALYIGTKLNYTHNKVILDDDSIKYVGRKRSASLPYKYIDFALITFINFGSPIIIVSNYYAHQHLHSFKDLPYVLHRRYFCSLINDNFIFFEYSKEALEIIKECCNIPIYDEYLLYEKGVEDAV